MENHWLNKKKKLSVEDVRLAKELEVQGVEGVCEYAEMAEQVPIVGHNIKLKTSSGHLLELIDEAVKKEMTGEITIGTPIYFSSPGNLCISGTKLSEMDSGISSITVSNGVADLELKDGSIKYVRETRIGDFIFKDAGALGIDIFTWSPVENKKIGWLNSKGKESLTHWLNEPTIPVVHGKMQEASKFTRNQEYLAIGRNQKEVVNEVSNEVVSVFYACGTYKLNNENIIPGSLILTAFINGVRVQSENLCGLGSSLVSTAAISKAELNYKNGTIIVSWANFNPDDQHELSFCYEYRGY